MIEYTPPPDGMKYCAYCDGQGESPGPFSGVVSTCLNCHGAGTVCNLCWYPLLECECAANAELRAELLQQYKSRGGRDD